MSHRSCAALAGCLSALALLPATAGATMPGAVDGRITYFLQVSGTHEVEIYSANADGTDQVQLTHNPGHGAVFSDWSPDGRQIAFDSDRPSDGEVQVYVMPPTGDATARQVTAGKGFHGDPAWSPTGEEIAFEADWGSRKSEGIYALPATADHAHKGQARVIDLMPRDPKLEVESEPQFSPDGQQIVFTRFRKCTKFKHGPHKGDPRNCESAIFIKRADGTGEAKRLTPWGLNTSAPDWAPDGSAIVFDSHDNTLAGDKPAIWRMKPDGSARTKISPDYPGIARKDREKHFDFPNNPVFAPTGDRVLYVRFRPAGDQFLTVPPLGGDLTLALAAPRKTVFNKPDWGVNTDQI